MKSEKEVLDEHLKAKNLKRTDQRFNILDIFLTTTFDPQALSGYRLFDSLSHFETIHRMRAG